MNKITKIAVIGGTISGNRGAEAMLVTTIGRIRKTNNTAQFYVFSYYPEIDKKLVNKEYIQVLSGKPAALVFRHFTGSILSAVFSKLGLSIPRISFFDCARALQEADLLLDIGGITFSDGREKFLPFNILTILPAMILGTPVIKLAQAVGPFEKKVNRLSANIFLKKCEHIFARGDKSHAYLRDLGFPEEKIDLVSDIAFSYKPGYSLSLENEERITSQIKRIKSARERNKKIVVLSPSVVVNEKFNDNRSYVHIFLNLMRKLGTHNYHFIIMPNATREGSAKVHNNDLVVIEQIKSLIASSDLTTAGKTGISIIDFDINTHAIRKIISEADLVLTSRYHAMISSLALCKPTIVIGWGHKYEETMALFNMREFVIDFADVDKNLNNLVLDVLDREKDINSILIEKLPGILALSEKQFAYLDEKLL